MTPQDRCRALFSGARMAMRLAHECKIDAKSITDGFDWCEYQAQEAMRHRERAAWYLEKRRSLKEEYNV